MRKASLVGFMTVALLQGCAGTGLPVPQQPPEAAKLPPFDGERRVVVEPLRGITKVDLVTRPSDPAVADPQKDLWTRIRKGFAMADLDSAALAAGLGTVLILFGLGGRGC